MRVFFVAGWWLVTSVSQKSEALTYKFWGHWANFKDLTLMEMIYQGNPKKAVEVLWDLYDTTIHKDEVT